MSVFVFDRDTLDMIRYILAMQRFKEYTVGPQGLGEHLCALSLERVLIQTGLKFPKFQKENPRDLRTCDIIRFLQQKNLINPTIAQNLNEYLAFHEDLTRIGVQGSSQTQAKANAILQFLCSQAGITIEQELEKRDFNDITTHKTQQPLENQNYEIAETDFDSLDKLYEKCPFIQREIEKRLTTPLKPAAMSFFTPNTGGIYLPFVTQTASDKRAHVERASIGVTFTPVDIRVGLNFGSQAHKSRIKYYELLLNGALMSEIESLNRKATGYCLCDTFWYYHIRNVQSLQWCLTLYGSTKLAIENVIEETRQSEGTPLTANGYLVSKVIERRPEDFTYIVKRLIDEVSKDLNELYPLLALIDKA